MRTANTTFIISENGQAIGSQVLLNIPASDIILSAQRPVGVSACNILAGKISNTYNEDRRFLVEVDVGISLLVEVTPGTLQRLQKRIGDPIYAIIKATAFQVHHIRE